MASETKPAGPDTRRRPDRLAPELLAGLGPVSLVARRVVDGFLVGAHRSNRRGSSAEFAELRAYRPGDDLRHVDWRMVGRSDRFFVKQFEEDTQLRSWFLLDASASMGWSSRPGSLPSKLWYGQLLTSALGLLLLGQGDRVGFAPFDSAVRSWLPPRGGARQGARLLREVGAVTPGGSTRADDALRTAALRLRRRGMIILVSDLLMDPESTSTTLRVLARQGHQVRVIHLMDPGERSLGGSGHRRFVDPETGRELKVSVAEIRDAYRATVDAAIEGWRSTLTPAGVEYILCSTDEPPARALQAILSPRRRQ